MRVEVRVEVGSEIRVKFPPFAFRKWCETNLVLTNPEYAKKQRMGFWTGNTPKTLALYRKSGDDYILPYGCLNTVLKVSRDVVFTMPKPTYVFFDCDVPLYEYQEKAVRGLLHEHHGILQAPAGCGKTQIGIALAAWLGRKTLWVTHTKDLLNQSKERAELYMSKDKIGTITEGKVSIGSAITFATVQTMANLDLTLYRDEWDCIIVDECHRVAGSPTAITQFSKVLNNLAARHKYGLSATVHRADGMIKATFALLGEIAYTISPAEVADKIMTVSYEGIPTYVGMSTECLDTDGTLIYARLINYLAEHKERNELILKYLTENKGHSCLILSDRLGHLETLMNSLPSDMREDAVMVSGKMTSKTGKKQREQAIDEMRNGTKKYLFATFSLAKEGLDIPRLDRLFLATPQKDYAIITQSVGRVARVFPGKVDPIVYDFVDNNIQFLLKAYKKRCSTYKKLKMIKKG